MFNCITSQLLNGLKLMCLSACALTLGGCSPMTLEEQFRGIEVCSVTNLFLDPVTDKASGQYFTDRKLQPCRIDEAAFYCVNDSFYGLTATQIAIPYRGPFSIHALYFKENPSTAEAVLRSRFESLKLNQHDAASPRLIENPKQQGSSVLYCDEDSE